MSANPTPDHGTDGAADSVRWRIARDLWRAIWRHRRRVIAALALLVLAKVAAVSVPLLLKRIVDALGEPRPLLLLPVFLLLAYAAVRFMANAFNELRDMVFAFVTQRCVADFTQRTFAHLHHLGARFHAWRETGAVIRDMERGTVGIGFLLGVAVFTIVPTVMEIAAVLGIIIGKYSFGFTVIIMATFAIYAVYTVLATRRRLRIQRQVNALEAKYSARMVDSLMNYDTVKYFAREDYESGRLGSVLERWVATGVDNQYALSALHIGQSACIGVGIAAVMLLAGQHVVQGTMTVGDVVLINAYIIQVSLPLNSLGFVFREANDALTNVERLFALLDAHGCPGEDNDVPGARALVVTHGAIEFDDVSFGYDPGRQILWNIAFRIEPGQTVAVVGGSGSGKSTLARLLFRFYQPDAGRILVDGQDIRLVTQRSLRETIGIVPQDTILFNDTLAYNIGYGCHGATRADIVEAARGARVDEFIDRLPDGYDSRVGERGVRLSGGERQRVAIARALLKRPPIIVFDEATSALDTRSERAIQAELMRVARDRTSLIIAHRLSTVVDADRILVMEHGRIVETGSHSELLARNGVYAQMWSLQQKQREFELTQERLARQPIRLEALVAGVVDGLRETIAQRRVELYTQVSDAELRVTGDPALLQKAVWDLCQRAIDDSSPGGRVELRLAREQNEATLSVASSDGHAPERAHGWPGLAEWQAVLENQGARLTEQSAADPAMAIGGGVAFRIAMPLRAVDETQGGAPAAPGDLGLQGAFVIAVDDNDDARDALAAVLVDAGAQVQCMRSGEALLAWLRAEPPGRWPRALVCDIALGEEDGYTVMRRVRQLEGELGVPLAHRVPAVALSGYAQSQERVRAMMAGFQMYLSKPVNAAELIAAVHGLIQQTGGFDERDADT